jgi:hypothetical protein
VFWPAANGWKKNKPEENSLGAFVSGRSTINKKYDRRTLEAAVTGEAQVFKAAAPKAPQNRGFIYGVTR